MLAPSPTTRAMQRRHGWGNVCLVEVTIWGGGTTALSSKENLGNLWLLGQKRCPKAGHGECALGFWKGYNTWPVLSGLRALMGRQKLQEEGLLHFCRCTWQLLDGFRGTSGWIEQHVLYLSLLVIWWHSSPPDSVNVHRRLTWLLTGVSRALRPREEAQIPICSMWLYDVLANIHANFALLCSPLAVSFSALM